MAFDFIDMIVDSSEECLTGLFYKRRPVSQEDGRVKFTYSQLDPNSKVFSKVLGEVRKDRANYAIKTNDNCGFNIGGYIQTQDGLFWEITDVITNEEAKGSNNVLRWFKTAKNSECNLRMVQVDDLFNIQDTYDTECNINVESNQFFDSYTLVYLPNNGGIIIPTLIFEDTKYITIPIKKGTSVKIILHFKNGAEKTFTLSADKTVVSELNYSVNV